MKTNTDVWLFFALMLLTSCGDSTDSNQMRESVTETQTITQNWNAAIDSRDFSTLQAFYAEEVILLKDTLTRDSVVNFKKRELESRPEYRQRIEYTGASCPDGKGAPEQIRIELDKYEIMPGDTYVWSNFLVFAKENEAWKIIDESNSSTVGNRIEPVLLENGKYCLSAQRVFFDPTYQSRHDRITRKWNCEFEINNQVITGGRFEWQDVEPGTKRVWIITGGTQNRFNKLDLEVSPLDENGNLSPDTEHITLIPISSTAIWFGNHNRYALEIGSVEVGTVLQADDCL